MLEQIGFIGLGKMGRPMTERLLAGGFTVHVFNRSRDVVDALAAKGAKPAASASEVAERGDVVLTALPTPDSVEEVYRELAAVARKGALFADHSTVSVEQSRRTGELLKGRGASFLDAPVSGGPMGAQGGTLTVMWAESRLRSIARSPSSAPSARTSASVARRRGPLRRNGGPRQVGEGYP